MQTDFRIRNVRPGSRGKRERSMNKEQRDKVCSLLRQDNILLGVELEDTALERYHGKEVHQTVARLITTENTDLKGKL